MTIRSSLCRRLSRPSGAERSAAATPRSAFPAWIVGTLLPALLLAGATVAPLAALAAPSAQEAPRVSVSARALFSGWVDAGRWTQIVAELRHESGPAGDVVLIADTFPGQVAATVEMAPGVSKRVVLLLNVERVARSSLSVQPPPGQAQTRSPAQTPLPLNLQDTAGRSLVVVVAEGDVDLRGLDALGAGGQPAAVALERPAELPEEPLAYASVDHLVLAGLGWEALSEGQRTAIRQWVGLGGHLLFTGGPSSARTLGRMPEEFRPASVLSTRGVAGLDALAALGGDGAPRGAATLAELVPAPGATVLLSLADGSPLAVQGRFGDGRVTALALDPFREPLRGWGGLDGFWRALARDFPLADTAWSSPPLDPDGLNPLLRSAQGLDLPPLSWLIGLLALYIFLVGPINHRLLRRYRRLDLAWLTIPLLSLVFTAVTYGLGLRLHGNDLRLDELSLLRAVPAAGVAHVTTVVSLSSPRSRSYELTAERGSFRPVDSVDDLAQVWQERQSRLSGLAIDQWSQRQVVLEAVIPWPAVDVGPLTLTDSQVRADQPNPLGRPLEDAQLLVPGGNAWLGDVTEGGQLRADLNYEAFSGASLLRSASEAAGADPGDAGRRWALLQAFRITEGVEVASAYMGQSQGDPAALNLPVFRRPDALLLGWTEQSMLTVAVKDQSTTRRAVTLIHTRLPIDLGGKTPRFINGVATTRGAGSAARCGPGAALLSVGEPSAEFSFPLGLGRPQGGRVWLSLIGPANEDMQAQGFPFGENAFPVRISLWNQEQGGWLTFNVLSVGQSAEIPRVISRDDGHDQIRLRLEADLSAPDTRERWSMFDGCVEPRVAIQEGVAPKVFADGLVGRTPAPDATAGSTAATDGLTEGTAAPPRAVIPTAPAYPGKQP